MELRVTGFPPSFVIPAKVGIHKNGIVCYWIPDQVGNDKKWGHGNDIKKEVGDIFNMSLILKIN